MNVKCTSVTKQFHNMNFSHGLYKIPNSYPNTKFSVYNHAEVRQSQNSEKFRGKMSVSNHNDNNYLYLEY